jgi:hypothetical protein
MGDFFRREKRQRAVGLVVEINKDGSFFLSFEVAS